MKKLILIVTLFSFNIYASSNCGSRQAFEFEGILNFIENPDIKHILITAITGELPQIVDFNCDDLSSVIRNNIQNSNFPIIRLSLDDSQVLHIARDYSHGQTRHRETFSLRFEPLIFGGCRISKY